MDKKTFLKKMLLGIGAVVFGKAKGNIIEHKHISVFDNRVPLPSGTPTASVTPSVSPSSTPSSTPSSSTSTTPSTSPSSTPSSTPSQTPTATATSTSTPSASRTPTPTPSSSATPSSSITATPSVSLTPSITSTPSNILPVDLLYFDATLSRKGDVMLTFATSSEYNNQGFDILRKRESSNFELIHSINSKGNSHSVKTYSYQDRNLTLGETYIYELVQIDNNGTRTSKGTRAISIINTEIRVSEVFYKSFNHTANIVIDAPNSLWVTIHILEPSGQKVYDQKFRISKTNQTLEIPVKKLSNGLYIFHINYLQSSVVRRIVINH